MRRNSSIPRWCLATVSLDSPVSTRMPGIAASAQAGWGFIGRPLPASGTSTRQARQAATGSSSGWSQNRGISRPIISAARMTSVPLGTSTSVPSMVKVTVSGFAATSALMPHPLRSWTGR